MPNLTVHAHYPIPATDLSGEHVLVWDLGATLPVLSRTYYGRCATDGTKFEGSRMQVLMAHCVHARTADDEEEEDYAF